MKCPFPLSLTWQLQLLSKYIFLNTMTDELSRFIKKISRYKKCSLSTIESKFHVTEKCHQLLGRIPVYFPN